MTLPQANKPKYERKANMFRFRLRASRHEEVRRLLEDLGISESEAGREALEDWIRKQQQRQRSVG